MFGWFLGGPATAEVQAQLALAFWLWARLLPLFVLAPWLALGVRPGLLGLALSGGAAAAFWPIAIAGQAAAPAPNDLQLWAASVPELLRGSVFALGAAAPFAVLRATGGLADALRGANLTPAPEIGPAELLARLYALAGLVAAAGVSVQLGAARLFVDALTFAPLGSPLAAAADLGAELRNLGEWMFRAFELAVTLGAPLLLCTWLGSLLFALSLRVAGRIVAPWPSLLSPWFALSVVCLSIATTLDEIPGVVRLFARETRRALETLH